ncbi:MAG TPA: 30S ribosomal protein S1 [Planctomycetes bacterium]|nr:30S ribosomal protein S1 [Planctomycetota bacterium]
MSSNKLLRELDVDAGTLDREVAAVFETVAQDDVQRIYQESVQDFSAETILNGKVVNVFNNEVIVDVGYKSEGIIPLDQFDAEAPPKPGDQIEVLLESVEDESGLIVLSRRKAARIRGWERVISTHKEGDVVRGKVVRKIKGGLLVDIGVPVFLPASQVGIRRAGDIGDVIGQEVECKIIKIDESRMNIVVSRRKLLEERRDDCKRRLMTEIEVNQLRKGVVKNITEFGAFVDLGGIDGLLHITDMSWGRVGHPSEVLQIEQELEVLVLKVDKDKERISLGLKQKSESPWARIDERFPVGARTAGKVVSVLPYGAFVEIAPGVEGLVHISEMSWTKRINHPSAIVKVGDEVEVVVLEIKKDKQEISLGIKQTDVNPWSLVEQKYPVGTIIEGRVRNLTNYGAFVELEEGIDGLLHVSDMSWTRKITHPSEVLKKGDIVRATVLSVDQERKRVALGMKQMVEDPWLRDIPDRYQVGHLVEGEVTKITNFGVFVRLEPELEGLLHISELADHKVGSPEEVVKVGEKKVLKIIRVDQSDRKIGLSLKEVSEEDLVARDHELTRMRATSEAAEAAEAAQAAVQGAVPHTSFGAALEAARRAAEDGPAPGEDAGAADAENAAEAENTGDGEAAADAGEAGDERGGEER